MGAATLFAATERNLSLIERFGQLPRRFSRAALLPQFPRAVSLRVLEALSPRGEHALDDEVLDIKHRLAGYFAPSLGFGAVTKVDYTDGVRVFFDNGDVAHVRPSGNADELRIYAVADSQARADAIAAMGVAEPDGILRQIEKSVG